MKLIRRSDNLFPAVPFFFDNFLGKDSADWLGYFNHENGSYLPAVNISETDDNFEIELAVPGLKKDDFKVELDRDILTISSSQKENKESKNEKQGIYKKEFSYHSFRRSFSLPEDKVNPEKISANYENGVLRIEIPKKEEAKPVPARLIEIS